MLDARIPCPAIVAPTPKDVGELTPAQEPLKDVIPRRYSSNFLRIS